jgi:hypothetical protein
MDLIPEEIKGGRSSDSIRVVQNGRPCLRECRHFQHTERPPEYIATFTLTAFKKSALVFGCHHASECSSRASVVMMNLHNPATVSLCCKILTVGHQESGGAAGNQLPRSST